MARNDSFFNRLTKLFKSGPAIQRRIKGQDASSLYDTKLIQGNYGYRAPAPFGFGRENSPFSVLGSYGMLDRMARYAEFGEMEYTPEIATALDIYCIAGDVTIPLLDGSIKSVKELFDSNKNNFWVYSFDVENNKFVPGLCKKVVKTGKNQKLYKVKFDDESYLRLTENHLVLMVDGTYKKVKNLTKNDSVRGVYRKLSTPTEINKLKDYEMILQPQTGWQYTHRMVSDKTYPEQKGVCHHKNCIKKDNRPENLQIMSWKEHQEIHRTLNSTRWKNDKKYAKKMSSIFSKHAKKMHAKPGWTKDVFLARRNEVFASYDSKTRKEKFGRSGSQNGMYNKGYKLQGQKNGRWNSDLKREIDKKTIVSLIESGVRINEAAEQLNTNIEILRENTQKYGLEWKPRALSEYRTSKEVLSFFKKSALERSGNVLRQYKSICDECDISRTHAYRILNKAGYKNWNDFVSKINHKVVSVEEDGQEDVYDLQVKEHHNFAAGINGGYTIIHNSDETVGGDEHGHSFHVFSDNTQVKKALEELFYDVLNVEFNIRMWVRNLVKYGDFFLYNEVLPDAGVINAQPIPVSDIEREEGFDEEDPYSIRFKWLTRGNVYLENWQITHFRILGNDMFLPYGTAVLEPARRIWRQLIMMEDAMLVYRVVRSPERRVFYIDVGNVAPNDVPSYMEAAKATLRSHSVIDKSSGRQDMRYNPLAIDEDYYIPVRGAQSGTKIETLAGGQHVTATEDVTYIQSKLFAALKVPKPYLNYDENLSSKATLAQTDVRFSRTITAIQKIVVAEMTKLAMIHLFAKGFDGEDLINFSLKLSNPSTVALQQKLELWSTKMDIAGTAKETALVDERWIQKVLLELTDDDIDNINKGLYQDRIKEAQLEQVAFEDENFQPTTTDAFSPSNYNMPGENIPKKQDPEDTVMQPARDIVGIPKNKNQYKINYKKGSTPIKATPFLNRHRKNRKRRVGAGGKSNLATPDFSAMMNPSKNKSLSDIYDNEYLKNPTKREGVEYKEDSFEESINVSNIKAEPNFTNELKSIFKNLKKSLTVHRKRTGMLTEDFDFEDDAEEASDSEELLIESVLDDNDNDDSTPKSLKEAFVNNEKPDKQKEDEKEKDELIELEIE